MKLKNGLLIAFGTILAFGTISFWFLVDQEESAKAIQIQTQHLYEKLKVAEEHLHNAHPMRALAVLREEEAEMRANPALAAVWLELALEAAQLLEDDQLLQALYDYQPDLFKQREALSLRLAKLALINNDTEQFANLRTEWLSRSHNPNQWFLLEADDLALNDKPQIAINLLSSQILNGDEEIERLLRLALLNEMEHPKIAWEYLSRAIKLDPSTADLYYYRAQLLQETEHKDLAVHEFEQAMALEPDPIYREDLIDFYLNQHKLAEAYSLVKDGLETPTSSQLWLKALFLNRVYKQVPFEFAQKPLPEGEMVSVLRYLLTLTSQKCWDSQLLCSQPLVQEVVETLPETLWMAVLGNLKVNDDIEAYNILKSHPEMASLYPELYNSLQIAISYRFPHLHLTPQFTSLKSDPTLSTHPLFKQLKAEMLPDEVSMLLSSKESYAAIFLAAGWYEAALNLHQMQRLPADFPRWVSYGLVQAFAHNRGHEQALSFARLQSPSPQLSLLIGELELKQGDLDAATLTLTSLAKSSSDVGSKATALLAQIYTDLNQFQTAKEIAASNVIYASSLKGQEHLAHLAIKMGNLEEAEILYNQILDQSIAAKSFMAAKAYQRQDYKLAKNLTCQMLEACPERKDLQKQLAVILKASKEQKNAR